MYCSQHIFHVHIVSHVQLTDIHTHIYTHAYIYTYYVSNILLAPRRSREKDSIVMTIVRSKSENTTEMRIFYERMVSRWDVQIHIIKTIYEEDTEALKKIRFHIHTHGGGLQKAIHIEVISRYYINIIVAAALPDRFLFIDTNRH